jgi:hypothetical protein
LEAPARTGRGIEPHLSGAVLEAGVKEGVSASHLAGVPAPVQEMDRYALARPCHPFLGRCPELRTVTSSRPKVSEANALRPLGARLKVPTNPCGRRAAGSPDERHGRDGASRTGVDPTDRSPRVRDGMGPGPARAMVETAAGRNQDEPLCPGWRRAHAPDPDARRRTRSLWNRSSHARRVRGTPSGKPVNRCSTRPSLHSRNT